MLLSTMTGVDRENVDKSARVTVPLSEWVRYKYDDKDKYLNFPNTFCTYDVSTFQMASTYKLR